MQPSISTESNNDVDSRMFTKRNAAYKIGFFLMFPSFTLFLVSFGSPSWHKLKGISNTSWGLWFSCNERYLLCDENLNVLLAIRCIYSFCLAGCLFMFCIAFWENCRLVPSNYHSRKLEWFILYTAFLGTVANFLFLIYYISLDRIVLGSAYRVNSSSLSLLYASAGFIAWGNRAPGTRSGLVISQPELVLTQTSPYCPNNPMVYPPAPRAAYPADPNMPMYQPPLTPPPPYSLPPAYPGGAHHGPPPSSVTAREQRHFEASAPLIPQCEEWPKK